MRILAFGLGLCLLLEILLITLDRASVVYSILNSHFSTDQVIQTEYSGQVASGRKNIARRRMPVAAEKYTSDEAFLLPSKKIVINETGMLAKSNADNYAPSAIKDKYGKSELVRKRPVFVAAYAATREAETGTNDVDRVLLLNKAKQLKAYAEQQGYSTQYGFIVNMGMKSGKKRFFVVDLTTLTIEKRGIVAHGRGENRFTLNKSYSNQKGSNCTALGMYKVGKYYNGLFGPSYKLFGLQNTNSNAFDRAIVLHAMNCIPYDEIDFPIFQTEGCPATSPDFLKELGTFINHSDKPILMWIFDQDEENKTL